MRVGRRPGGLQLNRRGQAGPREGEQGLPRGPGSGQGSDQEAQRRRGAAPGPQSSNLGCESRRDQRGKDGGPRPHRNPGRTLKPRPRPVSLQPLSEVPCRGWDGSGESLTSGTGVPDGARSLELQMAVAMAVPLSKGTPRHPRAEQGPSPCHSTHQASGWHCGGVGQWNLSARAAVTKSHRPRWFEPQGLILLEARDSSAGSSEAPLPALAHHFAEASSRGRPSRRVCPNLLFSQGRQSYWIRTTLSYLDDLYLSPNTVTC